MKIRRLLNWLKMGCTVLVTLCILGTVGTLAYVHSTGLPEPLKNVLIEKLEEEKLYLSFDSLKYKLNQGIVAENAKVYKSAAKEKVLLSADEIKLNIDKTKLLRKVFELDSVIVDNGKVAMELAPDIPDASDLVIDGINGEFSISKDKKFESADGLSFHFEGIKIVIKGQAWETWETEDPEYPPATLEEQQAKIDQFDTYTKWGHQRFR